MVGVLVSTVCMICRGRLKSNQRKWDALFVENVVSEWRQDWCEGGRLLKVGEGGGKSMVGALVSAGCMICREGGLSNQSKSGAVCVEYMGEEVGVKWCEGEG